MPYNTFCRSYKCLIRKVDFMKVLGVVSEYNPFHNGHLYHIETAKKMCDADYVVCVMSGNFVQRGEPALLNKWTRTKMALLNGIDVVIELPLPYCISSAYLFALGSMKLLNSLNIISDFCFGSEVGDIDVLKNIASTLTLEPLKYKYYLKAYLSLGYSFPKSQELSLVKYLYNNSNISDVIALPNNILGIEYLKAHAKLKSNITCHTIKRTNSYHSLNLSDTDFSSSAIRNFIKQRDFDIENIYNYMPKSCASLLLHDMSLGLAPIFFNDFNDILLSKLRCLSSKDISKINHVNEGFENRLKKISNKAASIDWLVSSLNTKRYTDTRIKRILLNTLFGITKQTFSELKPSYIRILGASTRGKELLGQISKNASLPVLLNSTDCLNLDDDASKKLFELECLATNIYVLAYKNNDFKYANQDLTTKFITDLP